MLGWLSTKTVWSACHERADQDRDTVPGTHRTARSRSTSGYFLGAAQRLPSRPDGHDRRSPGNRGKLMVLRMLDKV